MFLLSASNSGCVLPSSSVQQCGEDRWMNACVTFVLGSMHFTGQAYEIQLRSDVNVTTSNVIYVMMTLILRQHLLDTGIHEISELLHRNRYVSHLTA